MRLEEALNQVEHRFEDGLRKRYACSHCGKTWVEIVGFFSIKTEGQEDIVFRLGEESEACRDCKAKTRTCHACGSTDTYEINYPSNAQESPLSFNRIRIVSKT